MNNHLLLQPLCHDSYYCVSNQVVVLQLHDCLSRDSRCQGNNSKCLSLCCNSVCHCRSCGHLLHRLHVDNLVLLSCKEVEVEMEMIKYLPLLTIPLLRATQSEVSA